MRLLFITPNPPSTGRAGGATILYNYLKRLATRHRVDLVTFQRPDEAVPPEISSVLNKLIIFNDPDARATAINYLKGLIPGWPISVAHYASSDAQKIIADLMQQEHYDAVVCQMTSMTQFVPRPIPCASLVMVEDPQSIKFRITPPWPQHALGKVLLELEIGRIERYERRVWKEFGRVVMLNPLDIAACQKLYPQAKLTWLAYGVDADYFAPRTDVAHEEDKIIISGTMNHPPNVEAIINFCDEIYPLIVAQRPTAHLWIVGANPTPEVQALAERDSRIHVTGRVKDMRDYLVSSTVSVCNVRLTYGSQTKVLEAMACGVPVVALPQANVGTSATPGQHLLVAATPVDFAASVLKVLEDPDYRQTISAQARYFIESERAWPIITDQLERLLYDLVHAKRLASDNAVAL